MGKRGEGGREGGRRGGRERKEVEEACSPHRPALTLESSNEGSTLMNEKANEMYALALPIYGGSIQLVRIGFHGLS